MPQNDENTALDKSPVQPAQDAGQSAKPEVTQATQPAIDPQLKEALLADLRKENATLIESERRRLQGQTDAQLTAERKRNQAQAEAERQAMLDALKEVVQDEEVLKQVKTKVPLYQKAALQDLSEKEQQEHSARVTAEQQAYSKLNQINQTYGLTLTKDDFPGDEWGGGRTVEQWAEQVALPKALQKKLALEREALSRQVETERKKAVDDAASGASAVDLGGGGVAPRKPKNTLNDAYDLEDAIRRNIFKQK